MVLDMVLKRIGTVSQDLINLVKTPQTLVSSVSQTIYTQSGRYQKVTKQPTIINVKASVTTPKATSKKPTYTGYLHVGEVIHQFKKGETV